MKLKKVYGAFVICFLLVILSALPVLASDSLEDRGNIGSITIRLEDTKNNCPKGDVHIIAAKIAEIVDGEYVLHSGYSDTGIDLNEIKNANELASAAEKLEQLKPKGIEVVTDYDGVAIITDLSAGMYLVYACDLAEYENIMPSLVSNPMWNEEKGNMVYDIEILAKHAPDLESPGTPQTGDGNRASFYGITVAGALLFAGSCLWMKRKR